MECHVHNLTTRRVEMYGVVNVLLYVPHLVELRMTHPKKG